MDTDFQNFLILMGLTIGIAVIGSVMGLLEQKREIDKQKHKNSESTKN